MWPGIEPTFVQVQYAYDHTYLLQLASLLFTIFKHILKIRVDINEGTPQNSIPLCKLLPKSWLECNKGSFGSLLPIYETPAHKHEEPHIKHTFSQIPLTKTCTFHCTRDCSNSEPLPSNQPNKDQPNITSHQTKSKSARKIGMIRLKFHEKSNFSPNSK